MDTENKEFPVVDTDFRSSINTYKQCKPRCVQVAIKPEGVAVRDSKDAAKKTLFFTHEEWVAFTKGVKEGEFEV
ncbi:MAG: DUF397 domain-containing protein [Patescibacteria group bacterium]|nr:DUF397 domain-containing protein [Patescibacteria group bacterium]